MSCLSHYPFLPFTSSPMLTFNISSPSAQPSQIPALSSNPLAFPFPLRCLPTWLSSLLYHAKSSTRPCPCSYSYTQHPGLSYPPLGHTNPPTAPTSSFFFSPLKPFLTSFNVSLIKHTLFSLFLTFVPSPPFHPPCHSSSLNGYTKLSPPQSSAASHQSISTLYFG